MRPRAWRRSVMACEAARLIGCSAGFYGQVVEVRGSGHVKRRKVIWEALHPAPKVQQGELAVGTIEGPMTEAEEREGIEVEQAVPPQNKHPMARPQDKAFAAETAAITGESKQSINRHVARADALGDDLVRVTGTSLDKGVELDALAKLPEPERQALIERAVAGEKVTARAAPVTPGAVQPGAVGMYKPIQTKENPLDGGLDVQGVSVRLPYCLR